MIYTVKLWPAANMKWTDYAEEVSGVLYILYFVSFGAV